MTTSELLRSTWSFDPLALGLCAGALGLYALAAKPRQMRRALYFAGALVVTALALMSPIAALARGVVFSAHMLQHLLLVLVVPLLGLLALPPHVESARTSARARAPTPKPAGGFRAWQGWLLGVGAMWLWHAPALCNAATSSGAVHAAQTASLLGMGAAFWWPIIAPDPAARIAPLSGIMYLFSACIACTALGVLITFSPVAVCSAYAQPTDALGLLPLVRDGWGLSSGDDQRIGGLLMWVPACLIYGSSMLTLLARWYDTGGASAKADALTGSRGTS